MPAKRKYPTALPAECPPVAPGPELDAEALEDLLEFQELGFRAIRRSIEHRKLRALRTDRFVLALDVEGTLISSAVSQFPRPGLNRFLRNCADLFERIVIYTTIPEDRFRTIARGFVERRETPPWFATTECVSWSGAHKRPGFVAALGDRTLLLVDDMERYVHPDDRANWITLPSYDPANEDTDKELERVLEDLVERVRAAR